MHGVAPRSGAPKGNQNALKNGLYTREALAERRAVRDLIRSARQLAQKIECPSGGLAWLSRWAWLVGFCGRARRRVKPLPQHRHSRLIQDFFDAGRFGGRATRMPGGPLACR